MVTFPPFRLDAEEGRLWKHRLGGAMRQAGIIAAAGIYAFEHNVERMNEDHENAKFLAEGLARIPGIEIDSRKVATNIVVFDVRATGAAPLEISARLRERGVLMSGINERQMRAVTHRDVDRAACAQALAAMADAVAS